MRISSFRHFDNLVKEQKVENSVEEYFETFGKNVGTGQDSPDRAHRIMQLGKPFATRRREQVGGDDSIAASEAVAFSPSSSRAIFKKSRIYGAWSSMVVLAMRTKKAKRASRTVEVKLTACRGRGQLCRAKREI